MKEVSSSTWTFQMIIIFMLIFAGFLALVLTYSKAFSIKNRFLTMIEKYDGITSESIKVMNNFAINKGYIATYSCPEDWYGVDIYNDVVEIANENEKYNYCFIDHKDNNGLYYYEIQVFYKFNLPFLNSLGLYKIEGKSKSFRDSDNKNDVSSEYTRYTVY